MEGMIYEGKAKKIFFTEKEDEVLVYYKDDATAFNGEKKGQIDSKGILNNKISSLLFELLIANGIPTHFIKNISDREMLVKRLTIIPVEVVVRNIAAGSLAKKFGWEEGRELPRPVVEFYYKNDDLGDPLINNSHIAALDIATSEEVASLEKLGLEINQILRPFFLSKNIELVDFKLEFGKYNGEILLGDEISPDTCRFWDSSTHEKLDKDRFRRDLGHVEEAYQEIWKRLKGDN